MRKFLVTAITDIGIFAEAVAQFLSKIRVGLAAGRTGRALNPTYKGRITGIDFVASVSEDTKVLVL